MGKKKYLKSIESLDKRIAEHREKPRSAKSPELFHYWEKEIRKFVQEKRKKQRQL